MLKCQIPNFKSLEVDKLVFDYNGTLACDGQPIESVKEKLNQLAEKFEVYILTADTFGTVENEFKDIEAEIIIIDSNDGSKAKQKFIRQLGSQTVIAVGNGSNDRLMLDEAGLGILVIGSEGASTRSLLESDLLINNINDVLDTILNPQRLVASLRE
ncbi:HAD family hydrolase [Acetohalobium arabaticum]|uniref:Haloacid dehalogenase domain protein hydrolase n=1 Tax=Acetohalobium arabaticum (strain ATCC 49924 / DSM 5501 / Z-7288) TaxID=574087 RepID=D9QQQ2_ACEAZ|nr:HAD family hydrolase [Acetohalobium arabaticum]ADL12843.1 Haloacid dehalogenase domain protein hydrolase [Acetohalobium arabaticum DSM 5501]